MKISYNWLKRYLAVDLDPDSLARCLTSTGLEVESVEKFETVKGGLEGIVVGEVMSCVKHPNADKLSLTRVDIGGGTVLPIVCGAPNVATGQKVPVATVGTVLYYGNKPFEIREASIRGELSRGMICAEDELGLGTSHEGIMVLDPSAVTGTPAGDYFQVSLDHVLEIGLTPNRTDAMSHIGVARDAAAALNQSGKGPIRVGYPPVDAFRVHDTSLIIPVEVADPDLCPRYSGVTISGVTVAESPAWLKNLLLAAGVRPINNIVDVTNFVLLEAGQPLHAFDAFEIKGNRIVVRKALKGEKFVTLDEVERELDPNDLMICDGSGPMCIAGVFGGATSGVKPSTTRIFLESAHFNPRSIRRTSRLHGLQTDASFRFERGSDPEITVWALKRAALLITEIAGGRVSSEIIDVYPRPVTPSKVSVRFARINRLVGKEIPAFEVKSILSDLGIRVTEENSSGLQVEVPPFKADVTREADVIEELLRIYGYDNIGMPAALKSSLSYTVSPDPEHTRELIAEMLTSRGFSEIVCNSLTPARYARQYPWTKPGNPVIMLNPLSNDLDALRQSLLFGGLETIAFNQNRKSPDLKLYEFGRIYSSGHDHDPADPLGQYREEECLALFMTGRKETESWKKNNGLTDFFDLKAAVHGIMDRLGLDKTGIESTSVRAGCFSEGLSYIVDGRKVVSFGRIVPQLLKDFEIRQDVFYGSFSWDNILNLLAGRKTEYGEIARFPEVRRDLALVLGKQVKFEDLEKAAFEAEKTLLKSVNLFDIYEDDRIGKDKRSYALSFILQDEERTLTDKVIEQVMSRILAAFRQKFGATLR